MAHTQPAEWSTLRHDADLQLDVFQANFKTYAFALHAARNQVDKIVKDLVLHT